MLRFFEGFAVATASYGLVFAAYAAGYIPALDQLVQSVRAFAAPPETVEPAPAASDAEAASSGDAEDGEARGRRRRRKRRDRESQADVVRDRSTGASERIATSGDDLGEDLPTTLDLGAEGGEQRVPAGEVEAAFDRAFTSIRRCLALAAGEQAVTGRIVFGLRVQANGSVRAVKLTGPAAVTTGESGTCLREVARQLRFTPYRGPDSIAKYTVDLGG